MCLTAGVDHVGVLVGLGEFPRELGLAEAEKIFETVGKQAKRLALSLSFNLKWISAIVDRLHPDILHLGTTIDRLSPEDVLELKRRHPSLAIMRSIPVTGEEAIDWAKQYDGVADWLLLDSHKGGDNQVGATGLTHDWSVSRKIVESVAIPVVLAGGLGPENVAEAIRRVRPFGVDSKTRTDREGRHDKDADKVRQFVIESKDFRS